MPQTKIESIDEKKTVCWRMYRINVEALKADARRKGFNPRNVPMMLNIMLRDHYFGGKKLKNQEE